VEFITPAALEETRIRPVVRPYADAVVGDVRAPLWIVLATMAFVLLIACANVAHLFLVRAEGRRQELAVRSALGAGRAHLLGLFVAEAAVLACAGAVVGVAIAYALLRALLGFAPAALPRADAIAIDGSVLVAVLAITVTIALAFGAVSQRVAGNGVAALRGGMRGTTSGRGAGRMRRLLMVSQVAFAALLLVGAGLTVRSFERLRGVDSGFSSDGILTFGIALPATNYPDPDEVAAFHRAFLERISALPGVEVAGLTERLPLTGFSMMLDPLNVRGQPSGAAAIPPVAEMRMASPGYFEALGIPLVRGRMLDWRDVETRSGGVLISARVARTFFPDADPIGQAIAHGVRGLPSERAWSDVVGVVGDVRGVSPFEEPLGAVYYPMLAREGADMDWLARTVSYVVRARTDASALAPAIRRELAALDPRLPMADVRLLDDVVAASRARVTFATLLLTAAALLGLVLGAIGLYGVTSIAAGQRAREIGVRIALGATPGSVRAMVLRQGVATAVVGLALGLGGAALLARFLGSLLFQVDGRDPLTYAIVAVVLLAVALFATWIPAARASKQDPRAALDTG
jgi:predicted permease